MNGGLADLTQAVARVAVTFLAQATILITWALVAARWVERPAVLRSAIYRASVIAVAVLPLVAALLLNAGVSVACLPFPDAPAATSLSADSAGAGPSARPESKPVPEPASTPSLETAPPATMAAPLPAPSTDWLPWLHSGLVLLWGVGASVLLARLIASHVAMSRIRKRSRIADNVHATVELGNLAEKLGIPAPALRESGEVRSPILTGILRPMLLLPAGDASIPQERLRALLLHELAHLVRRDCLLLLLARVACAVYFFHPLLWILVRRMEQASDEVADDTVLASGVPPTSYARDLADWAARYLPAAREQTVAVGLIRFRSALARRVRRILDTARRVPLSVSRRAGVAIAAGVIGTCLCVGLLALGDAATSRLEALMAEPTLQSGEIAAAAYLCEGGIGYVDVSSEEDLSKLCRNLESGSRAFKIWCRGDMLGRLPRLPGGRDLTLWCDVGDLTDLSALEKQTGIAGLAIRNGRRISDLSPLAGLTQLRDLSLIRCPGVHDLRPLGSLPNLSSLTLALCWKVSDLSPLENLTGLTSVTLAASHRLADLGPLARLPNLQVVELRWCPNADPMALTRSRSLRTVHLVPRDYERLRGIIEQATGGFKELLRLARAAGAGGDLRPLLEAASPQETQIRAKADQIRKFLSSCSYGDGLLGEETLAQACLAQASLDDWRFLMQSDKTQYARWWRDFR